MNLTEKERLVVLAALTELNIKLSKGLSNSGIEPETIRILEGIRWFHESDVTLTFKKIQEEEGEICRYRLDDGCYYTACGREFLLDGGKDLPHYCDKCGGCVEEVSDDACCLNEKRNINGGCDSCGDPCL
jgi:hypothetical protein